MVLAADSLVFSFPKLASPTPEGGSCDPPFFKELVRLSPPFVASPAETPARDIAI
jgi:hypothetical protein